MMRLDQRISIVLALVAAGCAGPYGSRGGSSGGDPYYRGDLPYGPGLSRHEARVLAEQQSLEQLRLQRLQRERRENLLERQDKRRNALEATGEWDARDARSQRRDRRAQKERFEDQREELRDYHDREWDR